MTPQPKTIVIIDEKKQERTFEVLFTHLVKSGQTWVFYFDPKDDETVFVARYDGKGHLEELNDDELSSAQSLLDDYDAQGDEDENP